ncbi:hypothetical protein K458DRAFT_470944 [Lentithecium fluviatile CBS 122367]|uniref:Uncharacterized protein n=1 Tax=Lentithecium fluviatile CBS 122367 TaxID=1168545 RepID=A0A6G1J9X6_9PLEO|nr:hypothetical protein K458DRAFT_470944 [Lentithecium fluviatile CBS 122367]
MHSAMNRGRDYDQGAVGNKADDVTKPAAVFEGYSPSLGIPSMLGDLSSAEERLFGKFDDIKRWQELADIEDEPLDELTIQLFEASVEHFTLLRRGLKESHVYKDEERTELYRDFEILRCWGEAHAVHDGTLNQLSATASDISETVFLFLLKISSILCQKDVPGPSFKEAADRGAHLYFPDIVRLKFNEAQSNLADQLGMLNLERYNRMAAARDANLLARGPRLHSSMTLAPGAPYRLHTHQKVLPHNFFPFWQAKAGPNYHLFLGPSSFVRNTNGNSTKSQEEILGTTRLPSSISEKSAESEASTKSKNPRQRDHLGEDKRVCYQSKMNLVPNCPFCNAPTYPGCFYECERLQVAVMQAEQRAMNEKLAELRFVEFVSSVVRKLNH